MVERDTSEALRIDHARAKATGAALGGSHDVHSAMPHAASPRTCPLDFLLPFIRKPASSDHRTEEQ
jgi:hypothetical protein